MDDRKQAAKDFAEGDKAFKAGSYKHAAESYERAYKRLPHPSSLWNAARAWHRAGERARAANLYAQYLREAPASARDRNSAQKALKDLSNRLARVEIHATDIEDVKVDGTPIDTPAVYVTPGAHVVEGRTKDSRPVRQAQNVEAGDVVSVALVPPPIAPAKSVEPEKPADKKPAAGGGGGGWSPAVFYVGGAVTLALAGVSVWSGLDTLQAKNAFDQNPTPDALDAGRQKQLRTNILIGATAGVGVLTLAAAAFFVDWSAGPDKKKEASVSLAQAGAPVRVRLGLGPASIRVFGEF